MNYPQEIDYHIELPTLKQIANTLIENKVLPINAKDIFEVLKNAVINSEVAPFLKKPITLEKDSYYEKYLRLEEENKSINIVPDFFNHEGDFYDMDRNLNFSRSYVNDEIFKKLFALKLIELNYSTTKLHEFIDFQLYDNYNGNKDAYGYFLQGLMEKDSIFYLLPSIVSELQQWIKANEIHINLNENEEDKKIENADNTTEILVDHWETKKNQKVDGKMNIDEIRHFFSFLYKEKIEKSINDEFEPILTKDEVDLIFANGLVIPTKPLEKKLKLNIPPRFPKKVIDNAIYKFYYINSYSQRDKKDYVLFFANYIEDYESALNSSKALESLSKNITGENSRKVKIKWDDYIPKRFH
jgi:hypothetical protein